MIAPDLPETLSVYAAGLEAELALLRHLERLCVEQQDATRARDSARLTTLIEERARLVTGLAAIEHDIRDARQSLAQHRFAASGLPGFADVAAQHKAAGLLVARILAADDETMEALKAAEIARREAVHAIEAGETTLNAYRRVITPVANGPALFDERG